MTDSFGSQYAQYLEDIPRFIEGNGDRVFSHYLRNCYPNAIKMQLALASVMAAIATFKGVFGGSTGGLGSIACSSKLWVSETVVDMGKSRGIDAGGTGT